MINNRCTKCGAIKSKTKEHICRTSVWNKGKKGVQVAWNKDKKSSQKTKDKLSDTRKKMFSNGKLKKLIGSLNPMFGKIPHNKGIKTGIPSPKKGTKVPLEIRLKTSGKNHYNWKGGMYSLNMLIRKCYEYRQWVQDIFKRDDYTCQECGKRGGQLQAHHIKPFALIIKENKITTLAEALLCYELWDYDNGQTLCLDCHKKTDSYLKGIIN